MLAINALKSYSCCLCGSASSSLCIFLSKNKSKREMNDKKKRNRKHETKQLILKTSLVCGAFFSLSFSLSLHFLRQFTIHKLFLGFV